MSDIVPDSNDRNASARVEALLFVANLPVTASQIGEALNLPVKEVEAVLKELEELYQERGLSLQHYSDRFQLTTYAEYAQDVEKFLGLELTSRLSRAAIETMTIIAYRQPITRPAIESIRGVSSDGVMRSLLSRGLIQEVGRAEGPGRPILFSTTVDFLQHFGLNSLDELPPYELEGEESEQKKNGLLKD